MIMVKILDTNEISDIDISIDAFKTKINTALTPSLFSRSFAAGHNFFTNSSPIIFEIYIIKI